VIDLTSEADLALPDSAGRTRVLLIENDPLFATLVANILEEVGSDFVVDHAPNLAAAVTRLGRDPIDLILTEINLPDSFGASTVGAVRAFAPGIPMVVLSDTDDVLAAVAAIREGADEYIVKGRFSIDSLVWLVRLVLERHRRTVADPPTGFTDPATGLATLPALQMAGQQCLLTAERAGLHAGIAFVEVQTDPRRELADREHLLLTVGDVLQTTLRRCDLVSRLPGEELAVLLVSEGPLGRAVDRLTDALAGAGLRAKVRVGFAAYDAEDRSTVDMLLEQARSNAHPVST
jgi:DNA-binding response OmpR family regulator